MTTEDLQELWNDDDGGEYIQIHDCFTKATYVAHGVAMQTIELTEYDPDDDIFEMIRDWTDTELGISPNLWQVNDHGNVTLFDYDGNSLGGLV